MATDFNKIIIRLFEQGDKLDAALMAKYETQLAKILNGANRFILDEIAKMYFKYGDDVDYSTMATHRRLFNIEKRIQAELLRVSNNLVATSESALAAQYEQTYLYTGYVAEKTFNTSLGYTSVSRNVLDATLINPLDRIRWQVRVRGWTYRRLNDRLKTELAQSLVQGLGFKRTAANLERSIGNLAWNNLLRIVRTETHRVQEVARAASMEKAEAAAGDAGIKTLREWVSTLDSRTRVRKKGQTADHREIDGQRVKPGEKFKFSDGVETEIPGSSGVARHDIQCRCVHRLVIDEKDFPKVDVTRRDGDGKVERYKNYKEWEKAKTEKPGKG